KKLVSIPLFFKLLSNTSNGVLYPNAFLGILFIFLAIFNISSSLNSSTNFPFLKYLLIILFLFSLQPLSYDAYGCVKYIWNLFLFSSFVDLIISSILLNSTPLSNNKLSIILLICGISSSNLSNVSTVACPVLFSDLLIIKNWLAVFTNVIRV